MQPRSINTKPDAFKRFVRLLRSLVDPRSYLHLVRIMNYYNYAHVAQRRKLTVGPNAEISPNAVFSNAERIAIGRNLELGDHCHLWAGHTTGRITIGDDVMFGPGVMVTAATYRYRDGQPVAAQTMDEADVVIGDDVWIGAHAVILPGSRIGSGSIIGAGSVVQGTLQPMSVAIGNPARVFFKREIAADGGVADTSG